MQSVTQSLQVYIKLQETFCSIREVSELGGRPLAPLSADCSMAGRGPFKAVCNVIPPVTSCRPGSSGSANAGRLLAFANSACPTFDFRASLRGGGHAQRPAAAGGLALAPSPRSLLCPWAERAQAVPGRPLDALAEQGVRWLSTQPPHWRLQLPTDTTAAAPWHRADMG